MKAILIIEMPKNCNDCPCAYFDAEYVDADYCGVTADKIKYNAISRPDWCPLRPLPENMTPSAEWIRKIQYGDENGSST